MMFYFKSFIVCLSFLFCHLVSAHPIHKAIQNNDIQEIQRMLDEGMDINAQDEKGNASLHIAIWHFKGLKLERMATYLLKMGADPNIQNDQGNTPFHTAPVFLNNSDFEMLAKLFLAAKADPYIESDFGKSVLEMTASFENKEKFQTLQKLISSQ